jgi:hypothetical protein
MKTHFPSCDEFKGKSPNRKKNQFKKIFKNNKTPIAGIQEAAILLIR